ncbi:unnamed protein product [Cylicocyclus nassatus]|uniref:Uncharacterized protein n=1 Tax=Cylicocyclus nassatus TaxID=53992 RepID=A0AA36DP08_CYLNA|nr:unnamed protein product [Cylicocyclus nassatus]
MPSLFEADEADKRMSEVWQDSDESKYKGNIPSMLSSATSIISPRRIGTKTLHSILFAEAFSCGKVKSQLPSFLFLRTCMRRLADTSLAAKDLISSSRFKLCL